MAALSNQSPAEDVLITAAEVAALLTCKPRSVARYVPFVMLGGAKRWRRSDVLRFINGLSPRAVTAAAPSNE